MGPAFVGGDVASFVYEFDDVTAAGIASFIRFQSLRSLSFCFLYYYSNIIYTGNMSTTIALTYPNSIPIMSRTSSEDGGLISCILLSVYRFFSTLLHSPSFFFSPFSDIIFDARKIATILMWVLGHSRIASSLSLLAALLPQAPFLSNHEYVPSIFFFIFFLSPSPFPPLTSLHFPFSPLTSPFPLLREFTNNNL